MTVGRIGLIVFWSAVMILILAALAFADPCRSQGGGVGYSCTRLPHQGGGYERPAVAYAPVYRDREIVIADAYFPLFDYRAKDVFVFTGPPPAALPGLFLGYNGGGTEVRGLPSGPVQQPPSRGVKIHDTASRLLASEDAARHPAAPVVGWESAPPPRPAPRESAAPLASLRASCASCHTQGSEKGGFVLFSTPGQLVGDADWKAARDAVTSGRMPKPGAGKPPVSEADKQEIARRAGGG